jgi:hypothetical protein
MRVSLNEKPAGLAREGEHSAISCAKLSPLQLLQNNFKLKGCADESSERTQNRPRCRADRSYHLEIFINHWCCR